jgi:lysine 6-dehydrogenase
LKIAVLGGAGLTGQCAVRDLLRSRWVDEILVGDYNVTALESLKSKLKGKTSNVTFKKVDVARIAETASSIAGFDVVINAVQYYYNLAVMSSALKAGTNYLDFGGLFHTTLRQISEFNRKFKAANLIGVAGMGAQPGITNLMVKKALSTLDRAESIEIFDGWKDMAKASSALSFTWSPLTFFDESAKDAIVFENGKYLTRPPLGEPETVRFPKPVGDVVVYTALHSEIATIPRSFRSYGVKRVVWKEGGTDIWKIRFLADLGLTSDKSVDFAGTKVSPRHFLLALMKSKGLLKASDQAANDFEISRVIAKGSSRGRQKRVVLDAYFPSFKPWKVSCSQYNVGIPGSIAAQMIARRRTNATGVLPAEMVFDPPEFFCELESKGIKIRQRSYPS